MNRPWRRRWRAERTASTRPLALCLCLALSTGAPALAMPADQARVDEGALDACVAAADDRAAATACIGAQQAGCVAQLKDIYKDVGPVDGRGPCLGAERDYWDRRLTDAYDRLMAVESQGGRDRAEALRQAERAWIAWRDAICTYEGLALAGQGDVAGPACLMRETARQALRVGGYLAGND